MNLKQTIATGLLTVIAFGSLTFMPASADSSAKPTRNVMRSIALAAELGRNAPAPGLGHDLRRPDAARASGR